MRRRSSWGRGIIRKKKANKKGAEGEAEAEGEEEEEEPEAETEATGPSDSCLTLDEEESSCDMVGPQTNGHAPSTEEESSNETPTVATAARMDEVAASSKEDPRVKDEDAVEDGEKRSTSHAGDGPDAVDAEDVDNHSDLSGLSPPRGHAGEGQVEAARAECVNGNESMDSVDSGSLETGHCDETQQRPPEVNEHKETHSCKSPQERHIQDGRAAVMEQIPDQGEGEVSNFFFCLYFLEIQIADNKRRHSGLTPFQLTLALCCWL